jgi:hypothetical protein
MAVVLGSLVACKKGGGDECERFWTKTSAQLAKVAGDKMPADAKDKFLEECRTSDRFKKDPAFQCVLDAKDDSAVTACTQKAFDTYESKAKASEAKLNLNHIGKNAKVMYAAEGAFPVGNVGPTPAQPCCAAPDHECPVNAEQWNVEPWASLDFTIDEPHVFQYTYESTDGKTATATAVGDPDCSGKTVTYKVELTGAADHAEMKLIEPDAAP